MADVVPKIRAPDPPSKDIIALERQDTGKFSVKGDGMADNSVRIQVHKSAHADPKHCRHPCKRRQACCKVEEPNNHHKCAAIQWRLTQAGEWRRQIAAPVRIPCYRSAFSGT